MISKNAYKIASVIVTGAITLHDLSETVIFQGVINKKRKEMLLSGLAELCRNKLLIWRFEPDYGNAPPIKPSDYGEKAFLKFWRESIDKSDLSVEIPDRRNPTLFLEAAPRMDEKIDNFYYDKWRSEDQ